MRRFVVAALLVASGVLVPPASAQDTDFGAGFQSFSLTAVAGGQRVIGDTLAGQPPGTVQSGVPDAEARMTKSTAYALSSIAWPSALAGNAGTLLALLGPYPCTPALPQIVPGQPQPPAMCSPVAIPPEVMAQYPLLNSPIRAEAIHPVKPSETNNLPAGTMSAQTTDRDAVADAIIGGALATGVSRLGTTRATSTARLTGAAGAVADARSLVTDIDVLGVLTIGSVTSIAHAETNGTNAVSSGVTTVQDMKVNGIPIVVDAAGVHVGDQVAGVISPITEVVNQALAQAGIKVTVTQAVQTVKDGTTTFDAGSLVIEVFPPGAPGGVVLEFGGAHVTASATLPFQADLVAPPVDLPPVSASLGTPSELGAAAPLPSLSATGSDGPTLSLEPASRPAGLPGGVTGWVVVLGLAAALAAAAGLRRLPDRVLDGAVAQCETGETT